MRMPTSRGRGPLRPKIEDYEVRDAANTIARAREHLANPKMMKAIRRHVNSMNDAISGGLKPKRVTRKPMR
ncbi:MAG: hypothetical protein KGL39_57335 [Patescibacteria group bacterium]|nr:hypothetical protein [Patescibacteria group bacterium]